ncbi:hypothetical protein EST38_g484 [Candolleomyces aberdarensis]|uniref:Uncharacterized protein n=1 Tax=Candolleomyces aberdarensis TaxID=2316362 RepID=A0A4V1Q5F3_9AGAR|nr:hypothetical protein EST38_g484 [Candolleomyces aberdarensis]
MIGTAFLLLALAAERLVYAAPQVAITSTVVAGNATDFPTATANVSSVFATATGNATFVFPTSTINGTVVFPTSTVNATVVFPTSTVNATVGFPSTTVAPTVVFPTTTANGTFPTGGVTVSCVPVNSTTSTFDGSVATSTVFFDSTVFAVPAGTYTHGSTVFAIPTSTVTFSDGVGAGVATPVPTADGGAGAATPAPTAGGTVSPSGVFNSTSTVFGNITSSFAIPTPFPSAFPSSSLYCYTVTSRPSSTPVPVTTIRPSSITVSRTPKPHKPPVTVSAFPGVCSSSVVTITQTVYPPVSSSVVTITQTVYPTQVTLSSQVTTIAPSSGVVSSVFGTPSGVNGGTSSGIVSSSVFGGPSGVNGGTGSGVVSSSVFGGPSGVNGGTASAPTITSSVFGGGSGNGATTTTVPPTTSVVPAPTTA